MHRHIPYKTNNIQTSFAISRNAEVYYAKSGLGFSTFPFISLTHHMSSHLNWTSERTLVSSVQTRWD